MDTTSRDQTDLCKPTVDERIKEGRSDAGDDSDQQLALGKRQFLKGALGVFAFTVGGVEQMLNPAQARAQSAIYKVLTPQQVAACEAVGEALVPSAREAGIAHYIDAQLNRGADSLLIGKYIGVNLAQQTAFYQAIFTSFAALLALPGAEPEQIAQQLFGNTLEPWQGPPQSYAGFVFRADCIDVVYGTEQGFSALDIPYMAHIKPKAAW